MLKSFWRWYERHKTLNLGIAAGLFTLQLVHLYWLTTNVVFFKIFGKSLFNPSGTIESLLLIVDYTEIPALIATSLVYLSELRKKYSFKSVLYLIFLNSQWLHIFWITDEFVVDHFIQGAHQTIFPFWLAWMAILIDYLELPVIFDTLKKFFATLQAEGFAKALEEVKE